MAGGDQRAHFGRGLCRVIDLQLPCRLQEAFDKGIERRPLDEHPAAGAAVLAGIGEHAQGGTRRRFVEVGVGEDDVGRLAAQLQRDPLQIPRGQSHETRTNLG